MIAFLKGLVLLPVAIVLIFLAIANRHAVTMSLDPFSSGVPELGVTQPLFVFLFAAVLLGVLLGGTGSWIAGAKHRRARRYSHREVNRLKAEADRLRATVSAGRPVADRPLPGRAGLPVPTSSASI